MSSVALRPQFDLCPHYLVESIVVHVETHILRHSLHDVVLRQNMTDNPRNPFLPADLNQTLQNVCPEPVPVKLIADNNSELRFAEAAHFWIGLSSSSVPSCILHCQQPPS